MPEISKEELRDKYPIIYRAFKSAEDFSDSPYKLLPEFQFIVKTCEEDPDREKEMALRIGIYIGVIRKMIELTEETLEFYKIAVKRYDVDLKRENDAQKKL
jgi:hypothetical protein